MSQDLPRLTGIAIHDWLSRVKTGSPSDFYKEYKKQAEARIGLGSKEKIPTYPNVVKYFWMLKQIGLVAVVRQGGLGRDNKTLYAIVRGREADQRWFNPQVELYPSTRWGGRRYQDAKREGLVREGRNPSY